jgi:putative endonuclease
MTINLKGRVWEHKEGLAEGFTKRYKINKLVYYEPAEDLDSALYREKQIKNYSRTKKISLINSLNPQWIDLYDSVQE